MISIPAEQGKLIVLEGLDGAGTTTQIQLLQQWLKEEGYRVFPTSEPSMGPTAKWLRQALQKRITFSEQTLVLLFLADRLDHAYGPKGFKKLLEEDKRAVVLTDRYYLSTFAYQTVGMGADESDEEREKFYDWLWHIHRTVLKPHLTIFLDVPPHICIRRLTDGRGYHYQKYEAKADTLRRVRAEYLRAIDFLRSRGDTILVVEGDAGKQEIHRRIRKAVERVLSGFTEIEKLREHHPLLSKALSFLQECGFQLFGAKEVAKEVTLWVGKGDPTSYATVRFPYNSMGLFKKIEYGGNNRVLMSGVQACLRPIKKEIEVTLEQARRDDLEKRYPYAQEVRENIENSGFEIKEVRRSADNVKITFSDEDIALIAILRYQEGELKQVELTEGENEIKSFEDKRRLTRAKQRAAEVLKPFMDIIREKENTPTLF